MTSKSDCEVSSREVPTMGESSLWIFCSPLSCHNHISLQLSLRFQWCSSCLFGKRFCSGFGRAGHQEILTEHWTQYDKNTLRKRHSCTSNTLLQEIQSISKMRLIVEAIYMVSKVTCRYLDPWHAKCSHSMGQVYWFQFFSNIHRLSQTYLELGSEAEMKTERLHTMSRHQSNGGPHRPLIPHSPVEGMVIREPGRWSPPTHFI